jgi:hypothetical protein
MKLTFKYLTDRVFSQVFWENETWMVGFHQGNRSMWYRLCQVPAIHTIIGIDTRIGPYIPAQLWLILDSDLVDFLEMI